VEGRPLDDAEAIARAQRGDVEAYEYLVKSYQGLAHRVAHLITGEASDAEDAAQVAFVKAYYALPSFRAGAPFRPWLLKIVVNEARNRRKAAGRRSRLSLRLSEAGSRDDAAPSPEALAIRRERHTRLAQAIGELPERDQLIIACRYFFDLSEAETAGVLGCARGTVKSRLSRALGRLKTAFLEEECDG
jgi:RNA polymerase sigma-70 factor (ECF subfamily)